MRGMGCMTYHGKEDVEVAGPWLEKKKRKRERVLNQM
jgi:hypothetical protein